MKFSLRDYQKTAIEQAMSARRAGYRRLLVCLPTGAGKTVIFSDYFRQDKMLLSLFQSIIKVLYLTY